MKDFNFCSPTRVVFGREAEKQVGQQVAAFGGTKVLLHYGGGSAERSGLLARIRSALTEAGIAYVELGGVQPNPRVSLVREAVELCRREGVDFILPVGGGSTIDSAKAAGMALYANCDPWDFYSRKAVPSGCVPIGCVLTIAATGSEMSDSSVITNEDGWEKRGVNSEFCRCRFALMNPELTMTLPDYQTACGCTDIMMHAMERYFCPQEGAALTTALTEALLRTMITMAKRVRENPKDYDARANIMWAGSLAHNNLLHLGNGVQGDWACHQLEHELGGMFDVAHGAGLAAVWGSWARYVYRTNAKKFARFAVEVCAVERGADDEETALRGIAAMEDFYRSIGMPTNLRELGLKVTEEQLDALAYNCTFYRTRTIGNFRKLGEADIRAIYAMAR